MNHLLRTTLINAPFSSVIEYVADFFEDHPHLRLTALASASAVVETRHKLVDDRLDTTRRHDALALSLRPWWPGFPTFEGTLTVRPDVAGSALGLEGSYEPPGGQPGRVFDTLIGQWLAHRTMEHLLRRLRRYVERRYREFLKRSPTIKQLNEAARIAGK